jgi:hypothetical protein
METACTVARDTAGTVDTVEREEKEGMVETVDKADDAARQTICA